MILGYEANKGMIYYGPKWSWAEMVMGRNDPESIKAVCTFNVQPITGAICNSE